MKVKEKFNAFIKNKYAAFIIQALVILIGCSLMGLAYRCFNRPNSITPSGFSGLSTLISELLLRINVHLNPSIIYILLNVVIFIIALRFFGLRFGFLTLIGILGFSVAMEYFKIDALVTHDLLLAAIMGGALSGVGIGIVFRAGGSTGGSDIIALLINKFSPKIRTGQCAFIVNVFVIALSIVVYGVNLALYAIIAIFVSGKMTDFVLDGTKSVRAYYIICDKDVEIADKILNTFHRGVTRLNAEGVFSRKQKKMLVCLITNHQAPLMKSLIKQIDPQAFVYSTGVREAIGESLFLKEEQMYKELRLSNLVNLKGKIRTKRAKPIIKRRKKYKRFSHKKIA